VARAAGGFFLYACMNAACFRAKMSLDAKRVFDGMVGKKSKNVFARASTNKSGGFKYGTRRLCWRRFSIMFIFLKNLRE